MKILFIHQNFPGQFKFLAPALASQGHQVLAMKMQKADAEQAWNNLPLVSYYPTKFSTPGIHPWLGDLESKIIRGEACFRRALQLNEQGYTPDLIIAHPGWGEGQFLKQLWPRVKLAIYCEFYYPLSGGDVGFDPEFPVEDPADGCRLQVKNMNNLVHFQQADAGLSPTHWQASTFPEPFRSKITVIHDGIDTDRVRPNPDVKMLLNNSLMLDSDSEVITFVNRNLEPYRGYHIFMRALPEILKQRPNAQVLMVGMDGVGYGGQPPEGKTWKDIFAHEVKDKISIEDWQRVHYLGAIPYDQFVCLLQLSTLHVYLTYPFVLSWSLLEAMSAGCCIVASDTQPLKEVIEHNQNGRLVDFFDQQGLAEQVCQLLAQPEERKRLSENARSFAIKHYDLQRVCLPQQLSWVESLMKDSN